MMAAAQPFISGAISKTVNMPKETTVEDVVGAIMEGWRLGLKALAIYRDGSKGVQVLSTKSISEKAEKPVSAPRRERLPDTRKSLTHKFSVSGHEGYITVGLYPDGRPGELFITMAKEGSTIGGLMDCFGTAVSMSLQYGVPLQVYVNKFSHTRFEPWGHTKNPDIRVAKSIVDYIFRWLGITFLPDEPDANRPVLASPDDPPKEEGSDDAESESRPVATKAGGQKRGQGSSAEANGTLPGGPSNASGNGSGHGSQRRGSNGRPSGSPPEAAAALGVGSRRDHGESALQAAGLVSSATLSEQFAAFQADAPSCDQCGAITVRNGNCYLCHVCGNSMGCS
jgi:ribonucleoside-diphosphate reductase alpha chain